MTLLREEFKGEEERNQEIIKSIWQEIEDYEEKERKARKL